MEQRLQELTQHFKRKVFSLVSPARCWVAGGCIGEWLQNSYLAKGDYDVFFPNEHEFQVADDKLRTRKDTKVISSTAQAVMYRRYKTRIHLVKGHFFATMEDTIDAFDFTVCCAAVDAERAVFAPTFLYDTLNKKLVINKLPFPLSTLERLQKYVRKGYAACNGTLLTLAKGIQQINFEDKKQNQLEFYPDETPRFLRFD